MMSYAVVQILSRCVLAFDYIIEDRLTANKNTAKKKKKGLEEKMFRYGNYIRILHTGPCKSFQHPIFYKDFVLHAYFMVTAISDQCYIKAFVCCYVMECMK